MRYSLCAFCVLTCFLDGEKRQEIDGCSENNEKSTLSWYSIMVWFDVESGRNDVHVSVSETWPVFTVMGKKTTAFSSGRPLTHGVRLLVMIELDFFIEACCIRYW